MVGRISEIMPYITNKTNFALSKVTQPLSDKLTFSETSFYRSWNFADSFKLVANVFKKKMFLKITFEVVLKCELDFSPFVMFPTNSVSFNFSITITKNKQKTPNFLGLIVRNLSEQGLISKTINQENTKKLTILTLKIVLIPFTELNFVRTICAVENSK